MAVWVSISSTRTDARVRVKSSPIRAGQLPVRCYLARYWRVMPEFRICLHGAADSAIALRIGQRPPHEDAVLRHRAEQADRAGLRRRPRMVRRPFPGRIHSPESRTPTFSACFSRRRTADREIRDGQRLGSAAVENGKEEPHVGVGCRRRCEQRVLRSSSDRRISTSCAGSIPNSSGAVDFGWFAFIAKPIFLILHWLARQLRATTTAGASSC